MVYRNFFALGELQRQAYLDPRACWDANLALIDAVVNAAPDSLTWAALQVDHPELFSDAPLPKLPYGLSKLKDVSKMSFAEDHPSETYEDYLRWLEAEQMSELFMGFAEIGILWFNFAEGFLPWPEGELGELVRTASVGSQITIQGDIYHVGSKSTSSKDLCTAVIPLTVIDLDL
ncbi:MAG: hypothetical protein WCJ29_03035 [bacterium]